MEGLALAMRAIHPGLSGSCKQEAKQGACESFSFPGLGQPPLRPGFEWTGGSPGSTDTGTLCVCHEESEANASKREIRASQCQKEATGPGWGVSRKRQEA